MRAEGILYARCGDLELRLEPARPAPPATKDETPLSSEDTERRSFEDLLHSSGVDPEPFLALMAQQRAA